MSDPRRSFVTPGLYALRDPDLKRVNDAAWDLLCAMQECKIDSETRTHVANLVVDCRIVKHERYKALHREVSNVTP
jgi:hypothetical protein